MQRTLNRNSWHFWLAKKFGVVTVWYSDRGGKTEEVVESISVCQYVRGLILAVLFIAVAILLVVGLTYGTYLMCTIGNPKDAPWWQSLIISFGIAGWLMILTIGIVLSFALLRGKIRDWRKGVSKKEVDPDSFFGHVKAVYKEKICYQLK